MSKNYYYGKDEYDDEGNRVNCSNCADRLVCDQIHCSGFQYGW